jgi:BirA family biotin operon repressor/biotin-[acetyl-CoA-carboxylase] ligase
MGNHPPRPPLDPHTLRAELVGSGLLWRTIAVVDETGSTNADLLARAEAGDDIDGVVLIADHQTAGRGRHGRHWLTPPGAQLALSVAVSTADVPAEGWGWLPLATGIAVADALADVAGIEVGLKWPNDVVAGDGKLAGILAEVASPRSLVVVGLGLNVTLTAEEAPDPTATSLLMLGTSATDRNVLASHILRELATRIARWRTAGGADHELIADYRRYSCTLGTRVRVSMPGDKEVVGDAVEIDELGQLTVDTGEQAVTVSAGDVTHLRPVTGTDTG